ncbi:hypothetical protein PRZ48_011479 [Zasmidium cellare]|uniref:Uncharacterized protein n=1 Tax=Zasmidium cellare TaxID=395010 RepID=A0ABR0E6G7_ZASCE|nr:hypothetical protein PRZ48_011479 [Zasmidium cellare]
MVRTAPRWLKTGFPFAMMSGLGSAAVILSDFGNRIIDFIKHPSVGGFFGPVLSLLGWLFLLQGSFLVFMALGRAVLAKASLSNQGKKQAADTARHAEDDQSTVPLVESDGRNGELPVHPDADVQGSGDRLASPWGQGPTVWIFACMIVSQIALILGFFLPVIWLMHLERWGDDSKNSFGIFDFIFLLSSLLALVLVTELLAWALFFVLITIGDIVLDPGAPRADASELDDRL